MRIWLLTVGEPVPIHQGKGARLLRTGYFAHLLAARGHEVTWWTSTFDHSHKRHIFDEDTHLELAPNLSVRLLHGRGYRRNLSLARILDHRAVARAFAQQAPSDKPPAIIVAALPTIELSLEAVRFGRHHGVPVVLDMRDMWPDIFVDSVPLPLRPLARLVLAPLFAQARAACAGATAITGITEAFVEWGVERGGRKRTQQDRAFPMGYSVGQSSGESLRIASSFWDSVGIAESTNEFRVCFFGTLERQFDMHTVIEAARQCRAAAPLRFIICGSGSRLDEFRRAATGLGNIMFPGWVDAAQIHTLMRRCSIGLDPLPERYDFLATINNKAIEYLSAGLPVLSSPDRGVLSQLLAEHDCGVSYRTGDAVGLARTLLELAASPARVQDLSANARRTFEHFFTAERVYGEMADYLGAVAAASART